MNAIGCGLGHFEKKVKLLCSRVGGAGGRQTKCIFTQDGESDKTGNEVQTVADPGVNKKE